MPRSILVVDDNHEMAAELIDRLRVEGYCVSYVNSGAKALDVLAGERPNLMICDLELGDFTGYQVMEAAAVRLGLLDLPVMMAHDRWNMENCWLKVSTRTADGGTADCFVSKPYVVEEILIYVRRIFKSIAEDQGE